MGADRQPSLSPFQDDLLPSTTRTDPPRGYHRLVVATLLGAETIGLEGETYGRLLVCLTRLLHLSLSGLPQRLDSGGFCQALVRRFCPIQDFPGSQRNVRLALLEDSKYLRANYAG